MISIVNFRTICIILLVFNAILHVAELSAQTQGPKNIILMIGDGMGLTQISAAHYHQGSALHMESLPVTGIMTTHSLQNKITDSAAAGTALATGIKTYNGGLGVNKDTLPIPTILEHLSRQGYATGLVATCYITHATPGAFFAHRKSRNLYEEIAEDILSVDIDLFIAGGRNHFDKREIDNRNLVSELKKKGYTIGDIEDQYFTSIKTNKDTKLAYFTAGGHPKKKLEGRDWLPDATSYALNFLQNKNSKGFFVMIEGSQIDWAGHDNDFDYIIAETLDFDEAVGRALEFAKQDKETLLLVLADHETGGLGINQVSENGSIESAWTTKNHTGTMVVTFAYGPGADRFGGVFDNTDVPNRILELLGVSGLQSN
jgi:alkaline phosphatase